MSRFISKTNFQHVFNVSRQFLQDKHDILVPDSEFQQAVAEEMKRISSGINTGNGEDIDTLNKRAIIAVRNRYISSPPQTPVDVAKPTETQADENDDDEETVFLGKLRNLELQRTVLPIAKNVAPAEEPITTAPPPPPSAPTTIIFQGGTEPLSLKTVVVNSFDRLWMYETERNSFVYNHTFSRKTGVDGISVAMVVLPHIDNCNAAFYKLEVKNAVISDDPAYVSIFLVPSCIGTSTQWTYLSPVGTSAIQGISPPWILTLFNPQGTKLDMGHDGWVINKVIHIENHHVVCSCVGAGDLRKQFGAGDRIQIHHADVDTSISAKVINVKYGELEIELLEDGHIRENGVILNMSRQISLFLTVTEKK